MPTRHAHTALLAALLCAVLTGVAVGDDWPCWRGPDLNGISKETGWLDKWPDDGPAIAWRAAVGTGFSSVTVSRGRLYTMGNADDTDTVYCLDADTGVVKWKHSYPSPLDDKLFEGGPTSTPTVDGDHVYTLSRRGQLFCFDAAKGDVVWATNVHEQTKVRIPGWGFSASPVVHGELLLLNVGEAGAAINKRTGKVVWASADKDAGYATPVPYRRDGRWCAVVASGRAFIGIDVETGKKLWQQRWLTQYGMNATDPIVHDGHVLISSGYRKGAALLKLTDSDEPQVVWKHKDLNSQLASSVLIDGHLYGVDGDVKKQSALKCLDWKTGRVKWSAEGIDAGALTAADGKLIVLTKKGELIVGRASPNGFEPLARAKVLTGKCWTVPVLANGRICCRNADGDVVCVDVRPHERR